MKLLRLAFDLLPFLVPASAFAFWRWKVRHRASWPSAFARIETSKVVENDEAGGYVAGLTYSYMAEGEYYSGVVAKGFRSEKRAEQFLVPFPEGTSIVVRYNPKQPDISIPEDEVLGRVQQ